MNKMNQHCDICNEINGLNDNFFSKNLLKYYKKHNLKTRLIYKDENFFVIPSIGPISPCHLLLCPTKHIHAFSQLNDNNLDEGYRFLTYLLQLVRHKYGCAIAFEHGSDINGIGSSSCNHAHIHVLAAKIDLEEILKQKGFALKKISNIREIKSKHIPYFLIITNHGELWITKDTVQQSQFLRTVCATELGKEDGLWQHDIGINQMISTNINFNKHFK